MKIELKLRSWLAIHGLIKMEAYKEGEDKK